MASLPDLRVDSVRQVYNDGNHNAFTDLCRFKECFYLTFRSCPDGHSVYNTARIIVLSSEDTREWTQVTTFNVPHRDTRDPHFLIFKDRLFVYSGTWLAPHEGAPRSPNDHLGYGAWSEDGKNWEGPRLLEGTYGHYVWRAAASGDRAYLCGRRRNAFISGVPDESDRTWLQGAMLESDDGLVWSYCALFTESQGNETAFLFEDDGAVLALARGDDVVPARICRSKPPYDDWTRTELDRNVGGPLIARWGDHILVGGRNTLDPDRPITALYWLIDDALHPAAELPSGGDNSYPGFVSLNGTRGLLSFYSSHEGSGSGLAPSAIYLAELSLA
ncbi:MAG: hypothetical protein QGI83_19190 [Candidatus Latescibacteria bacterium]|nr:hypothetical protein [Candidatus Latescibacterota bacterium]